MSNIKDKYIRGLDDYNKEIVPHKLSFYNGVQGLSSFFDLLDSLSFNTDFYTSNFRWGKRFISTRLKDITWITSSANKKYTDRIWCNSQRTFNTVELDAKFTNDVIKKHFLSVFSNKRKAKFYYRLPDINKQELVGYETALKNLYLIDGKTFGASQQYGTDILLIDIDNYPMTHAIGVLKNFLEYLNIKVKDLIFIEQNAFTGGIHTAIKLPHKIVNNEFYSDLMSYMSEQNIRIECDFQNKILRLPLSYEYVALKHDERILDYEEFVPQDLWEDTFENYLNNLNFKVCNSDFLNNFIIQKHLKEYGKLLNKPLTKEELVKKYSLNKWENYWNIKKQAVTRVNQSVKQQKKDLSFYSIYAGNRYDTMSKLVPYCKMQGYSLDETVDIILQQNVNSKDLHRWSKNKLKHNIEKFYNNCNQEIVINNKFKGFISNISNLPKITLEFINCNEFKDYITNRFIKNYIYLRNQHGMDIVKLSDEKINLLKLIIPAIAKEIVGKMYYDINNPKFLISEPSRRIGFQLSDTHLKAIQDEVISQLGIDSLIAKTSLQYLKKAILMSFKIKEVPYKNRTRNWMLGSCKSYDIISLCDLYHMLDSLFNSMNNIYGYDYIIKNKFIHILYILLKENLTFGDIEEKIPI